MKEKRKINYYLLSLESDNDVIPVIHQIFESVKQFNHDKHKNRRCISSGGLSMQMSTCNLIYNDTYNCCMQLIHEEFPEVIDKKEDTTEEIPAEHDPDKGLYEETHFVISLNPTDGIPIVAVESTMKGVKQRDIIYFLNQILVKSSIKEAIRLDPVFAFQYDNIINRIEEVAQIKMMFRCNDIAEFKKHDLTTGQLLESAAEYTDSEYVTLDFKVNFQKKHERYSTTGLRKRFESFISLFRNKPEVKEYIRKLDVRAEDKQFGSKLRLFDLIEEKVASEVPAEKKRATSKYYLSSSLYREIRQQIRKDFTHET